MRINPCLESPKGTPFQWLKVMDLWEEWIWRRGTAGGREVEVPGVWENNGGEREGKIPCGALKKWLPGKTGQTGYRIRSDRFPTGNQIKFDIPQWVFISCSSPWYIFNMCPGTRFGTDKARSPTISMYLVFSMKLRRERGYIYKGISLFYSHDVFRRLIKIVLLR